MSCSKMGRTQVTLDIASNLGISGMAGNIPVWGGQRATHIGTLPDVGQVALHRHHCGANRLAQRFSTNLPNRVRMGDATFIATRAVWLVLGDRSLLSQSSLLGHGAAPFPGVGLGRLPHGCRASESPAGTDPSHRPGRALSQRRIWLKGHGSRRDLPLRISSTRS